jgi:hypothetical protein
MWDSGRKNPEISACPIQREYADLRHRTPPGGCCSKIKNRKMKQSSLKFIAIAALISLACTTKVSEWVLLNAPADKYLLVYYHKGTLPEPVILQNRELEKSTRKANLLFRQIPKPDLQNPYYALYYKNRLFARYDDSRSLSGLMDSPLRKKIAGELMEGQLCVLLYLPPETAVRI